MASEFQDYTFVLDKLPDGSILNMRVHVKYSWKFKWRMAVSVRLVGFAAWIMGARLDVDEVKPGNPGPGR
jgi:hypothetical protein